MHSDLLAKLQLEAYLWSALNLLSHVAIKDACFNFNAIVPVTNAHAIVSAASNALVLPVNKLA